MISQRPADRTPPGRRSFTSDLRGTVLVWAAILLPAFLGIAALAVDIGRLYSLQTQLQNAADAAALAAAAELDGREDAIARADAAIANLLANEQSFGNVGRADVAVGTVRYLTSVPASDAAPLTAFTTDAASARFVEVDVTPVRLDFIFPIVGGLNGGDTRAAAVAGRTEVACSFVPLFICNPFEGNNAQSLYQAAQNDLERRRQYILKFGPGNGGNHQWGPGNFGYLEAQGGGGASAIADEIASGSPSQCFAFAGADVQPGNKTSVNRGVNVRFDMYEGSMKKNRGNSAYRPALNTVRGYTYNGANACNADANTDAYGLPQDSSFSNLIGYDQPRVGNGNWDFVTYLQRNHWRQGAGSPPTSVTINNSVSGADVTYAINYAARTVLPAGQLPSRHDVYRWEIDNNRIPNYNGYTIKSPTKADPTGTKERAGAACYNGSAPAGGVERRYIYTAIVNCGAYRADLTGNSGAPIPVVAYARMFITQPVERHDSSNGAIYAEIAGLEEAGAGSDVFRAEVQLVR